jgi:hypothetical protein
MKNTFLEILCAGVTIYSAKEETPTVTNQEHGFGQLLVEKGWKKEEFKSVLNSISKNHREQLKKHGKAWAIDLLKEYLLQTYPNTELYSLTTLEGDCTTIQYKAVASVNMPKYCICVSFSILSY